MTTLVGVLGPRVPAFLDVLAVAAALAFLLLMVEPAYEFAVEDEWVTTLALDIPNSWRAAALPVGIVLMITVVLLPPYCTDGSSVVGSGAVSAWVARHAA